MISNTEILQRVVDRYDVYELADELGIENDLDPDVLDSDIEDFVKVFKTIILKNKMRLDIW